MQETKGYSLTTYLYISMVLVSKHDTLDLS